VTPRQEWQLECFRNSMCHLTKVLEDEFAAVFSILKSYETRHAGFDAVRDMRAARDSMMTFINGLDGVESTKLTEEKSMFSPHEEQTLKRLAAENTPLSRPVVDHNKSHHPATGDFLAREFAKCTRIETIDPEQDYEVINILRSAGVLQKGERVMEFFARTGIGRAQILTMTKDEIKKAVTLADKRNAEDGGFQPPKTFTEAQLRPAPRTAPSAILI